MRELRCHVNRYNALNQVGLIALSCLGEAGSANSFSFSNLNTCATFVGLIVNNTLPHIVCIYIYYTISMHTM